MRGLQVPSAAGQRKRGARGPGRQDGGKAGEGVAAVMLRCAGIGVLAGGLGMGRVIHVVGWSRGGVVRAAGSGAAAGERICKAAEHQQKSQQRRHQSCHQCRGYLPGQYHGGSLCHILGRDNGRPGRGAGTFRYKTRADLCSGVRYGLKP